jgi:uncharacterized DUF497 family protein
MELEFGPAKSESSQAKHGIDFEAAKDLWTDPRCLVGSAQSIDEERFAIIGDLTPGTISANTWTGARPVVPVWSSGV